MATLHAWNFDRLLDTRCGVQCDTAAAAQWAPAVDIIEDSAAGVTLLAVELPGLARDDVKITVDDNTLSISGERKNTVREDHTGYVRIERAYGSFARSFRIPTTIDITNITAEMKDGVLYVRLPKSEQAKPRQIDVKVL